MGWSTRFYSLFFKKIANLEFSKTDNQLPPFSTYRYLVYRLDILVYHAHSYLNLFEAKIIDLKYYELHAHILENSGIKKSTYSKFIFSCPTICLI